MNQEIPEIPDKADQLVAIIDKSRSEGVRSEVVEDVGALIRNLLKHVSTTNGHDSMGSKNHYKEARFKLVDNREADITQYSGDYREGTARIEIIERLEDPNRQINGIRKVYYLDRTGMTSYVNPIIDINKRDLEEPVNYNDRYEDREVEENDSLTTDEEDEVEERRWEGSKLEASSGFDSVSNKEAVDLIRLLQTSEQVIPQPK